MTNKIYRKPSNTNIGLEPQSCQDPKANFACFTDFAPRPNKYSANVIEVLGLFIGCLISTFHGFFAYGPEKSFLFPPNIVFSVEIVAYFYDIVMCDTS